MRSLSKASGDRTGRKAMHILAHFMIYAGLTAAYIGAVLGYI
jgi:hypothetical protein